MSSHVHGDVVFLRNLSVSAVVGCDAWQRPNKPQPIVIDLKLFTDITAAASQDAVGQTLNYGTLCKNVTSAVEESGLTMTAGGRKQWDDLRALAAVLCYIPFRTAQETNDITISRVELTITLPKGVLLAEGGVGLFWVIESRARTDIEVRYEQQRLIVRQMKLPVIIGVNPHERLEKQQVVIDLTLSEIEEHGGIWGHYHDLIREVSDAVEASSYQTLEALALQIARAAFMEPGYNAVTISVQKPSALTFVAGAGVEMTRTREQVQHIEVQA